MLIQNMFQDDINRKINGVIKVNQDDQDVIEQEVREYVITRELKKHFMAFFNYYCEMFDDPNADIGVWISGFFGSGKSHFIKMVSYILENRLIGEKTVVEMFRAKFADDPATFMLIDRATRVKAEPILFNIDIESSIEKDKKAVLRVFAKMFYNHLGFFGESLKVAQMEYYIDQVGKTEEFRRVFEEKRGMPWVQARKAFAFNRKHVVAALTQVLDMNEQDADAWCRDKSSVDMSTALLVDEIWNYVKDKPADFCLLFMIDEVGQYIGTDRDLLLDLQGLTEEIGRKCEGKVWVMCTGQEALDEIIKVRQDEFSRIQARFKVRLSLTSSSADEVIQKRLNRLFSQNYIGRSGDTWNFLTDEEQDIQKEINAINVDTASIVERLSHMIFGDIYTAKKYHFGKYDFGFDQMVDGVAVGAMTGGMRLKVLTVNQDEYCYSE